MKKLLIRMSSLTSTFILSILIPAILLIILSGCVSTQQTTSQNTNIVLSKEILDLINEAVCEIVVKKIERDSLTYEKDLKPFIDLLPLWYRNDKYIPIGTAFAVSETKLLTAMHVVSLGEISLNYDEFYIRDKDGQITEIGDLTKVDVIKDIVEFEAPGKKFNRWFSLQEKAELNTTVFSVGSIIGEGIISRAGLLTSSKKNEIDGYAWDILSFSADASSGNSGGPLLNNRGEVIGIILARNDEQKLGFALPSYEITELSKNNAIYYSKMTFSFSLFQDQMIENFSDKKGLPLNYKEYRKHINDTYFKFYTESMEKLLKKNEKSIFPAGKTSNEMLRFCARNSFPEVFNEDKNSKIWTISSTKTQSIELEKNGHIKFGANGSFIFLFMRKPDNISLAQLYGNPQLYMDKILEGINESRKIANQDIRITSYGKPFKSYEHLDKYKRKWLVNYWQVEWNDSVIMTFSHPCPMGMITVFKATTSSKYLFWEYDYIKILDFVTFGYYGTFDAWQEYLKLHSYIPEYFKTMSLTYVNEKSAQIKLDIAEITYDSSLFSITGKSDLSLGIGIYKRGNEIVWGPRRMAIGEEENKESFFMLYKELAYTEGLPDTYKDNWKSIAKQEHPLDSVPYYDSNMTRIAFLHNNYRTKTPEELMKTDYLYSMYLAIDKKLDDAVMLEKKEILEKGILILDK